MSNETKNLKIAFLITGLLLCLGVIPMWTYGYFIWLRLIVCGVAAYAAVRFKNNSALSGHFIPLVGLAILFNPIVPVPLTRVFWLPIDLFVAVYFLT